MTTSLAHTGVQGRSKLEIGGASVRVTTGLRWSESVAGGASLVARYDAQDGPEPKLGDRVVLDWEAETEPSTRGKLTLWCIAVRTQHDARRKSIEVVAADPLAFCAEEPQFRSYAGRVSLAQLAKAVLAFQPGRLPGMNVEDQGDVVPRDYLLQCRESGAAFLRRVAGSMDRALFWQRDRLVAVRSGHATGDTIDFGDSNLLVGYSRHESPQPAIAQLGWVDPATRKGSASTIAASPWSGTNGARGLARPARALESPRPNAWLGEGVRREWSGTLWATTGHAGVALGATVKLPGGATGVVDAIEHAMSDASAGATYSNDLVAVPAERWGVRRFEPARELLGPFQAVVKQNHDDQGLGRVCVALSEDPERRTTPWLPFVTPAAGHETGVFWMPEKESLVLVVAPAACPEALTVIGAVRGDGQRAADAWKSAENAHKVLAFRNGIAIVADDRKNTIRIETRKGAWELNGEGIVKVHGHELHAELEQEAKLTVSQGEVHIDGQRIHLG
jgi:Type VI secretion system/phage-baseplate injector OB domain